MLQVGLTGTTSRGGFDAVLNAVRSCKIVVRLKEYAETGKANPVFA